MEINSIKGLKIAIVHDYLNQLGGAERVVGVLHEMFPDAPIYTLFVDYDKLWPSLHGANIIPSFLQKYGFVMRHFKLFFWLYPFVIRAFRLGDYDIIISSSSAYAKGIKLPRGKSRPLHICYCYTPMRFAWDFNSYIQNENGNYLLKFFARLFVPFLKQWDVRTAEGVDHFIAISTVVQERIWEYYRRNSIIIFPPLGSNKHQSMQLIDRDVPIQEDYFLVVSRLVSYKRIDIAIQMCSQHGWRLIVIGSGPDRDRLEGMANENIEFLGWQSDEMVDSYMRNCKALIFPGVEDFGLTPLEVNLRGKPVVAYQKGGALDTIKNGINGVFFKEQTVQSLYHAILCLTNMKLNSQAIRAVAEGFYVDKFIASMLEMINSSYVNKRD